MLPPRTFTTFIVVLTVLVFSRPHLACGTEWTDLPAEPQLDPANRPDWLLNSRPYRAGVYRGEREEEIVLGNGIVRRVFRIAPNGATVALDNSLTGESLLRSVRPEAVIQLDGTRYDVGGLIGQPNHAYLLPEWLDAMTSKDTSLRLVGFESGQPTERFAWKRIRHHAPDAEWPPQGAYLRMDFSSQNSAAELDAQVRISVHYELYDGVPVFCKWITVENRTQKTLTVDRLIAEQLAVTEHSNWVEARQGVSLPRPESIHVETDFAFGGFNHENASRHVVHWREDPAYTTQVNYLLKQPCLLVVEPTYGPAQDVEPNETFESFRTFELIYDDTDRERRGLALRRMYRTVAPWTTENPLMHHMRVADRDKVIHAIDQAAEVGFEMVILSFGSGFQMENDRPEYLAKWKEVADYARSKGVEIGSYSLLSSRKIGGGQDIVSPDGQSPTHGNCPALTSPWGQAYFQKLYQFFPATGFTLLEHDGSYPGDVDVTSRPPLQKGEQDSRWAQWRVISQFYQWCRANGVYLNVPDYYYLTGANKCGMGYREVNWSLPREMQVIHTRQNIFDGTWKKTPSMGWMFVPLSQYHGGGAAATIEPLDEHLDHYKRMIESNLGLGVQACYRGPRLFDTDRTRDMVKQQVDWFKKYRSILESDVIHGRRADGRDVDWMLHVHPTADTRGMLLVYNPLKTTVSTTLPIDVYYTGIKGSVDIRRRDLARTRFELDDRHRIYLPVSIPAESMEWFVLRP